MTLQVANLRTVLDTSRGVVRAVDGIDFELRKGECFALVGESGSGKSMTALSLMRLLPEAGRIAAGRVELGDIDLLGLPEAAMRAVRGRRVAMIFQEPATALNPVLTCGRQIVVPLALAAVLFLLYGAVQSGRAAGAILLTAPFALTGGVFALQLGGMPLSVSAVVGFIALLGQVSLLGLLLVSAIEQKRMDGMALLDAVIAGSTEKLRAVLMAGSLALFGLLPMAISTGIGSETQRPFALVIVGGMVTTLIITLFVLPAVYYVLATEKYETPEQEDEAA